MNADTDPKSQQDSPEPAEAADAAPQGDGDAAELEAGPAESRVAALEAEVADLKDRLLRAVAEMDNLRKRTQREKEDAARYAITRFARDLVSVADDLNRALETATPEARAEAGEFAANLVTGVEMTERRLQQVFESHGLKRFDPAGEKFDPSVHEAMFEVPDPSQPAGMVAHVVEAGYMIGDRVLRPARVGVSSGGPQQSAAAEQEAAEAGGPEAGAADAPGEPAPRHGEPADSQPASGEDETQRIGIKIDRTA